jgi:aspartyl-tRNA(Asn)/glutamyl-tRNA(Gln) amidotransferase subunit A
VLTPTALTPAIPLTEVDQGSTPAMLTRWVNLLDLCALAVPNGFAAGGLPTSLQVVCRGGDEATALRIGWTYEAATDWQACEPAMVG